MNSFIDYQSELVRIHKHFKIDPEAVIYVYLMGLVGEAGEVAEMLKKHIRDDVISIPDLTSELGDVVAYASLIADYCNMTLPIAIASFQQDAVEKQESRDEELVEEIHKIPGNTLRMCQAAAQIAITVEYSLENDKNFSVTPNYLEQWQWQVMEVMTRVAIIANIFGIEFKDILNRNLVKLADRLERNQLHGSGSNR